MPLHFAGQAIWLSVLVLFLKKKCNVLFYKNLVLFVEQLCENSVILPNSLFNAVSFLADLGGLYCISIGIFFYFLVQV